jgi:hypothetical protein
MDFNILRREEDVDKTGAPMIDQTTNDGDNEKPRTRKSCEEVGREDRPHQEPDQPHKQPKKPSSQEQHQDSGRNLKGIHAHLHY